VSGRWAQTVTVEAKVGLEKYLSATTYTYHSLSIHTYKKEPIWNLMEIQHCSKIQSNQFEYDLPIMCFLILIQQIRLCMTLSNVQQITFFSLQQNIYNCI
jgi:hypothetical protein